jgi:hypothetical protein
VRAAFARCAKEEEMAVTRPQLIARMRRLRDDIRQMFADAASWNDFSEARARGCPPAEIDPTGEMQAEGLNR